MKNASPSISANPRKAKWCTDVAKTKNLKNAGPPALKLVKKDQPVARNNAWPDANARLATCETRLGRALQGNSALSFAQIRTRSAGNARLDAIAKNMCSAKVNVRKYVPGKLGQMARRPVSVAKATLLMGGPADALHWTNALCSVNQVS